MSKPSNSGRPPKRALIVVNDDESTENQPVEKSVRGEAEPTSLCDEIHAIQQKVAKLEKERQGAIRTAGEAQARAEFAENLINNKRVIFRDEGNRKDEEVEELQKKLSSLEEQLEEERAITIDNRMRDRARIVELERSQAANQKKVNSLKEQLDAEKSKANEDQTKASERIVELERIQAANGEKEKERAEKLKKKVNSLKDQLDAEKSRANLEQSKANVRIDELLRELVQAADREKWRKEGYQKKVSSLSKQLDEETSRANENRKRNRSRIDEREEDEDARAVPGALNVDKRQEERKEDGKVARHFRGVSPVKRSADRDRSMVAARSVPVYAEHYSMFTDPKPLPEKRVRKSLHPAMKL